MGWVHSDWPPVPHGQFDHWKTAPSTLGRTAAEALQRTRSVLAEAGFTVKNSKFFQDELHVWEDTFAITIRCREKRGRLEWPFGHTEAVRWWSFLTIAAWVHGARNKVHQRILDRVLAVLPPAPD